MSIERKRHHAKLSQKEIQALNKFPPKQISEETGYCLGQLILALSGCELRQKNKEKLLAFLEEHKNGNRKTARKPKA